VPQFAAGRSLAGPGRQHRRWPLRLTSSVPAVQPPARHGISSIVASYAGLGSSWRRRRATTSRPRLQAWPLRSPRAGARAPVTAESWDLSVACMLSSHGSAEAPCCRRQMSGAASRVDRRLPKLLRRSRQPHLNRQSLFVVLQLSVGRIPLFPVFLPPESCAASHGQLFRPG
jgi:hypothetical protein